MKFKAIAILGVSLSMISNAFAVSGGSIGTGLYSAEQLANPANVAGGLTDPMVTYTNPASLGEIGKYNTTLGGLFINLDSERSGNSVATDSSDTSSNYLPSFGFSTSFMDGKWGFGLALLSPYGLETEWSNTSSVRYLATKSSIKMFDLTPAVSYRHNEKIAFGFGLDYFKVTDASLERKFSPDVVNFLLGVPTLGSPDGHVKLEGDGSDFGYHLGVLYNATEKHSFGATYHSEVKMELEGDVTMTGFTGAGIVAMGGANFKTSAVADLFFPQNVSLGYGFTPNEEWRVGFDAYWYDWSGNQELLARLPNANATQKAIAQAPIPLEWKDVWSFALSSTFKANDMWKFNGGLYYISAAVPDRTFYAALPDLDRIGVSIGPSLSYNNLTIDTVYSRIFFNDRTVNNNMGTDVSGIAGGNGDYSVDADIFGINFRYKWGE